MRTFSDSELQAALNTARERYNESPTTANQIAWAKAQNALYDYQTSLGLGHTATRLDLRADGTVKTFGEP